MEKEKETALENAAAEVLARTPRLLIRRFGQDEWPMLLTYLQDDGIADGFPEGVYTEQRLRDMAADPYLYALVSLEDDQVIGHAFSRPGVQPGTGLLGFGIRSDYRRCGYGSEAAQVLFGHAFDELGMHRVTVSCPPENLALRAFLEKSGMRMEAFFRQSLPTIDGEWRDECVYALLKDEWIVNASLLYLREKDKNVRLEDLIAFSLEHGEPDRYPDVEVNAGDVFDTEKPIDSPSGILEETGIDERIEAVPVLDTAQTIETEEEESGFSDIFAEAGEPDFPQVTLALDGEHGSMPFAPILPAAVAATVLEPAAVSETIAGTVVGVQRPSDPLEGLIEQRVDGVPFVLRKLHDFNWLAPFGQVFRVWDRQDSGNLSFGLEIEAQRVFIKYAGATTAEYAGHPADAVKRLREAAHVYETLEHPLLVRMLDHFETQDGYAILFEWAKGQLLHPVGEEWNDYPNSAIARFRTLPIEDRIDAMEHILDFHAHVEKLGYVAIDFYDGSLIYDFDTGRITVCDIDFYRPAPYVNEMGRMWGSSRFMSPEEYELGAVIDSRTNVYNMGAMAFCLLGGERDRSPELWDAGDELYDLALRAASPERSDRWESVDTMLEAWRSIVRA